MTTSAVSAAATRRGAEDSSRYFKYMAEFIGFTPADAQTIAQTRHILSKYLPQIVAEFYDRLLRYPPTRKVFEKPDGTIDEEYVELRMRHQINFWLRSATGVFDDDYARYVDYVGQAHTAHGADPEIYIAERYVIGMVSFMQHALAEAMDNELHDLDHALADRAVAAWDKLMMVILEMLSRAYGNERAPETFEAIMPVNWEQVSTLAQAAFNREQNEPLHVARIEVAAGPASEIPEGERKIIQAGALSLGVFHHDGGWYAVENHCLHRGGPVATGTLVGDTLTCPWHGFQYNVKTGQLLVDIRACLRTFAVIARDGMLYIQIPESLVNPPSGILARGAPAPAATAPLEAGVAPAAAPAAPPLVDEDTNLKPNEFAVADLEMGDMMLVRVAGQQVAVYNVDGAFYATQAACTHAGGPLQRGELNGRQVTCPWHGSCFDVATGQVCHGPAQTPLKTYRVTVEGAVAHVEE